MVEEDKDEVKERSLYPGSVVAGEGELWGDDDRRKSYKSAIGDVSFGKIRST